MSAHDRPLPADPRQLVSAGSGWVVSAVAVLVLVAAGLWIRDLAILSVMTTVFMSAALAQAWNLLGGYGGYLNLGTAAFFGVGAYTSSILFDLFAWSPFATAVLGGMAAVILALLFGIPSLRTRGVYFAILTLVLTFLVQRLAFSIPLTGGAVGIFLDQLPMGSRGIEQTFYMIFLGVTVASAVLAWFIERSRFGSALVAIREDEDAAEILGVRTTEAKLRAFALGAFIMGLVGALFAQRVAFINPNAAFPINVSIDPVIMAMYGGAGTWQGPLIGAPLVVILGEILRVAFGGLGLFGSTVPAEASRLVFGAVLIGVALFARRGIMGFLRPPGGSEIGV